MTNKKTGVFIVHVPLSLTEKIDRLAPRCGRSRHWGVRENESTGLTREALVEVDAGHVIDHRAGRPGR